MFCIYHRVFFPLFSSLLCIETADRPGLLMEVIKIMADINVDVESAEIDTEVFPLLQWVYSLSSIWCSFCCNHRLFPLTGTCSQGQVSCKLPRGSTKQFVVSGESNRNVMSTKHYWVLDVGKKHIDPLLNANLVNEIMVKIT